MTPVKMKVYIFLAVLFMLAFLQTSAEKKNDIISDETPFRNTRPMILFVDQDAPFGNSSFSKNSSQTENDGEASDGHGAFFLKTFDEINKKTILENSTNTIPRNKTYIASLDNKDNGQVEDSSNFFESAENSKSTTPKSKINALNKDASFRSSSSENNDGPVGDGYGSSISETSVKDKNKKIWNDLRYTTTRTTISFTDQDAPFRNFISKNNNDQKDNDNDQAGDGSAQVDKVDAKNIHRRDVLLPMNIYCEVPHILRNSRLHCDVTRGRIVCNQTCNYGFTLKEGIERKMECKFHENKWRPVPEFENCKPFISCALEMDKGPGGYMCHNDFIDSGPICEIFCEPFNGNNAVDLETYKCDMEGRWSPELPFCASPASGIELVPPPTGKNQTLAWYWR